MGLRVGGFGILPQTVIDALRPREEGLESILNLPLKPIEIPKKKAELQKLALELDRQIGILADFAKGAAPDAKADLLHLVQIAREARLDIEGRLLSWAVTTADRRPEAQPLESAEATAVFALFGSSFSDGEMTHALTVLDAHLTPEDRRVHVNELVDATSARADAASVRNNKTNRGVFGARTLPVLAGLGIARTLTALVAFEPAVAMAINATAIQLGFQVAIRSGGQAAKTAGFMFGVNRFDGEADHDLALLYDRATRLAQSLGPKVDPKEEAERQERVKTLRLVGGMLVDSLLQGPPGAKPLDVTQDIALIKMLTTKRRETWPGREVSALEKRAVEKFEKLAGALEAQGVEGARGAIQTLDLKRTDLAELPSLPALDRIAHPLDDQKTMQAFHTAVVEAAKSCLSVANPSLRRLVESLEKRHLAAGTKLDAAELETLRRMVGESPNVSEVLSVGRLAGSGALSLEQLWPKGELVGIDGKLLDPTDAKLLFDTLGNRDRGTRVESFGRIIGMLAPFLGSAAAYFAAQAIGSPGMDNIMGWLGLLATVGTAIAANVSGLFLGRYVEKKGKETKLSQGLDPALAIGREYALELPRIFEPGRMLAGTTAEVGARLKQEAEVLGVMLGSLKDSRDELKAAIDALHADAPGATRDQQLARQVLEANLTQLDGAQGVHYQVLDNVRTNLLELAGKGSVAEMREGYAATRLELYGLMPVTWGDIIVSQTQHELSPELEIFYQVKHKLLGALAAHQPGEAMSDELVRFADIIANGYKELPKTKRPEKDDLDKLAAQILKAKEKNKPVDAQLRAQVLRPDFAAGLRAQRLELAPVTRERAGEIAQEGVTALWTQLLTMYGLVPDGLSQSPPKLEGITVTRIPGVDAQSLPSFRVDARIQGGGKVSIPIDAAGRIDSRFDTFQVDLGARLLGQLAEEATKHHLEALTGQGAKGKATLLSRSNDGRSTFSVEAGGRSFQVVIGPRGELDANSIRAS